MDTNLLNQLLTQIVAQKATEGLSSSTLIFIIAALMPTLAAIAAYLKAAAAAAGTKEISVISLPLEARFCFCRTDVS